MKTLFGAILIYSLFDAQAAQKSASFYQIDSLQEIRITFDQTNWDYLMDTAKLGTEETFLIAKEVLVNGVKFDSIGVKYKGNSTYKQNNKKNPLHIELNTIKKKQEVQWHHRHQIVQRLVRSFLYQRSAKLLSAGKLYALSQSQFCESVYQQCVLWPHDQSGKHRKRFLRRPL